MFRLLIFIYFLSLQLHASFPEWSGRVIDPINHLTEKQEKSLSEMSGTIGANSETQIIILLIPSLDGLSAEQYAKELRLFWGMLYGEKDHSILLIVDSNNSRVYMDVGHANRAFLTDNEAKSIVETKITPYLHNGTLYNGLMGSLLAISNMIARQYVPAYQPIPEVVDVTEESKDNHKTIFWVVLGFGMIPMVFLAIGIMSAKLSNKGKHNVMAFVFSILLSARFLAEFQNPWYGLILFIFMFGSSYFYNQKYVKEDEPFEAYGDKRQKEKIEK